MDVSFGGLVLLTIPFIISWLLIYTAVLAALRRHDRD
jgi:hypothetical protein